MLYISQTKVKREKEKRKKIHDKLHNFYNGIDKESFWVKCIKTCYIASVFDILNCIYWCNMRDSPTCVRSFIHPFI